MRVRRLLTVALSALQARRARLSLQEIPRSTRESLEALERGLGQVARGALGEGEADFREALELDLGNADAHLQLGALLLARGERVVAKSCFEHAARFADEPPEALLAAGRIALGCACVAMAEAYFARCLALAPGHREALVHVTSIRRRREIPETPGQPAIAVDRETSDG